MKKPRLCYCQKGTTCYPSDECPNKPTTNRKTYKERAEYLAFINPEKSDMYFAIAEFFGEDEIPPKFKKIK